MSPRDKMASDFYIDDHAALFGYLAKYAGETCREEGLQAIVKAIVAYGRERGLRMAMRCTADEKPLTMKNYILYGEWADPKGGSRSEPAATYPNYQTHMVVCGWCTAWEKYGLMSEGRLYCDWVDKNLVYGFNPELELGMGTTISHGGKVCEFDWVGCVVDEDGVAEMMARRAELIPRVTRDFLYHCGHLLSTFKRELYTEFGLPRGKAIVLKALKAYESAFGAEKREALVQESKQDFLVV